MHPYFSLAGRIALVTGGSRGIGQMIAQGLLEAGARVFICARDAEACADTATRLSAYGDCQAIPADLSSEAGARRLAESARRTQRAAGYPGEQRRHQLGRSAGKLSGVRLGKVMQLNVTSVFSCIQQLLPLLRRSASAENPARVINIGSVAGISAMGEQAYAYGPSKAALHQLSRMLAKELVGEHINVNVIAPGRFPSRMTRHIANDPQALEADSASIPMGRWGRPEEMAALAISLAGTAGAYMTGNVIPIDGGFHL